MIFDTKSVTIAVDNGHGIVEGKLFSLVELSSNRDGLFLEKVRGMDENVLIFFPSRYVLRYWFKGRWIYIAKNK